MGLLTVTYYLIIGEGSGLGVLAFQTPTLGLADEMLELFHSVAATVEFAAV